MRPAEKVWQVRERLDEHRLPQLPERLLREDLRSVPLQLLCLIRQPAEAAAMSALAVLLRRMRAFVQAPVHSAAQAPCLMGC